MAYFRKDGFTPSDEGMEFINYNVDKCAMGPVLSVRTKKTAGGFRTYEPECGNYRVPPEYGLYVTVSRMPDPCFNECMEGMKAELEYAAYRESKGRISVHVRVIYDDDYIF